MAIKKILQESAFDADVVKVMVAAYEAARLAMELPSGESAGNRKIAECVMRMARNGERDPQVIAKQAILEMQDSLAAASSPREE